MTRRKVHGRFLGRPSCYLNDFRKVLLASPWISERSQEWVHVSGNILIFIRRNYWQNVLSVARLVANDMRGGGGASPLASLIAYRIIALNTQLVLFW